MKYYIHKGKIKEAAKEYKIPFDKLTPENEAKIEKWVEMGKADVVYGPEGVTVYTTEEGSAMDPLEEAEQSFVSEVPIVEEEEITEEEGLKAMEENLITEGYKSLNLPEGFLKNKTVRSVIENFEAETNSQVLNDKLFVSPEGMDSWKTIYYPALKSYYGELASKEKEITEKDLKEPTLEESLVDTLYYAKPHEQLNPWFEEGQDIEIVNMPDDPTGKVILKAKDGKDIPISLDNIKKLIDNGYFVLKEDPFKMFKNIASINLTNLLKQAEEQSVKELRKKRDELKSGLKEVRQLINDFSVEADRELNEIMSGRINILDWVSKIPGGKSPARITEVEEKAKREQTSPMEVIEEGKPQQKSSAEVPLEEGLAIDVPEEKESIPGEEKQLAGKIKTITEATHYAIQEQTNKALVNLDALYSTIASDIDEDLLRDPDFNANYTEKINIADKIIKRFSTLKPYKFKQDAGETKGKEKLPEGMGQMSKVEEGPAMYVGVGADFLRNFVKSMLNRDITSPDQVHAEVQKFFAIGEDEEGNPQVKTPISLLIHSDFVDVTPTEDAGPIEETEEYTGEAPITKLKELGPEAINVAINDIKQQLINYNKYYNYSPARQDMINKIMEEYKVTYEVAEHYYEEAKEEARETMTDEEEIIHDYTPSEREMQHL